MNGGVSRAQPNPCQVPRSIYRQAHGERCAAKPAGDTGGTGSDGKRSAQAERPEALEPACRRGLKPEGARRAGFMAWLDAQHESPALSAAKGTHIRRYQRSSCTEAQTARALLSYCDRADLSD
ncbi:hypothetical protein ALQ33_100731 [Pseudomonas syringae pv. philadelphi]|uniref:Uncharacterized protein n=3 Tax=Pseudomonas syringae group TaxID=136849 RepID=A0A0P9NP96_PSESX|nr:hypothetical protein ALO50_101074 [Pseudomonas syringae pv. cerasicola]KPX61789.1 Uncharacterized protein ALO53_05511 [Pseudomonas amygdali pv. photiniae]RMO95945.1 hypothetical protein ALQ33_100731 [Pseudomonas syringae pv. philadelphi]